jgi:hypothetical protein
VIVHPRLARLVIAVSAGLLIGYACVWASVTPKSIGRSDCTRSHRQSAVRRCAAGRVWGIVQLLALIAAVVVAVRSARWPKDSWTVWKVAAALAAVAAMGTLSLLMEAQWTGVNALGLALAYRDWRAGKAGRGALWLVLFAGVAKRTWRWA